MKFGVFIIKLINIIQELSIHVSSSHHLLLEILSYKESASAVQSLSSIK